MGCASSKAHAASPAAVINEVKPALTTTAASGSDAGNVPNASVMQVMADIEVDQKRAAVGAAAVADIGQEESKSASKTLDRSELSVRCGYRDIPIIELMQRYAHKNRISLDETLVLMGDDQLYCGGGQRPSDEQVCSAYRRACGTGTRLHHAYSMSLEQLAATLAHLGFYVAALAYSGFYTLSSGAPAA